MSLSELFDKFMGLFFPVVFVTILTLAFIGGILDIVETIMKERRRKKRV